MPRSAVSVLDPFSTRHAGLHVIIAVYVCVVSESVVFDRGKVPWGVPVSGTLGLEQSLYKNYANANQKGI